MEQLVVLAGGKVEWREAADPELFAAGVEIDVRASAVSPGTETRQIRTMAERAEGAGPFGYSAAGVVRRVGPGAKGGFLAGQSVACYGAPYTRHGTRLVVPWTLAAPIPDGVSFEEAAFCGPGAIAAHAVRRGGFGSGSRVVVLGMGLIGQLQEQILRAWGCRTLAVDICADRLALAETLGCGRVLNALEGDLPAEALAFAPGGVDGVIVNTRLEPPMIDQAAQCCRDRGKIVMVGGGGDIRISRQTVFAKELDLLITRAGGPGRYNEQYELHGQDLPPGFVRWTEGRNVAHFVEMIATGEVNVSDLITHRMDRRSAPQAFDLLISDSAGEAVGIVFSYDQAD